MRIRVLGIGMGPQHVTPEVAGALCESDYIIAAQKSETDELLAVRQQVAAAYGLPIVVVPDPRRATTEDYTQAVADWHAKRVAAYQHVLTARGGTAAFLVWGDPSLYDSTIRIVDRLARQLDCAWDVLPGISAPQLLAARHRMVLHPVGQPVHVTTARRLGEDIAAGNTNLCVMLSGGLDLTGLDDWYIWWGANLGTESEELVSGQVSAVDTEVVAARERARSAAGWVMDVCLLRAP